MKCKIRSRNLHLDCHIFELNADAWFAMERRQASNPDASALLDKLFAMTNSEQARLLTSLSLLSKSGQRAVSEQVIEEPYLERLEMDPQGRPKLKHDMRPVGTQIEIDPVIGGDGQTLDLTLGVERHLTPAQRREINLATAGDPPIEVPLTDFNLVKVTSSLTLIEGSASILAVWRPADLPGAAASDLLHIAILKAHAP